MKITVERMKDGEFKNGLKMAAKRKKQGERLYGRTGKGWFRQGGERK